MAGADNLKGHGFHERTANEQREIAKSGGKASGAARRRKKALKTMLSQMLSARLPEEAAGKLKPLGIDPEDADYQAAVGAALIKKAMSGNVSAIQLLANLTGDDPYVKARQAEVKARQNETKLRREELAEKKRQFDLTREDRQAAAETTDMAAAWIEALTGEDGGE